MTTAATLAGCALFLTLVLTFARIEWVHATTLPDFDDHRTVTAHQDRMARLDNCRHRHVAPLSGRVGWCARCRRYVGLGR